VAGAEIAAILWPVLKVLAALAAVFGFLAFLIRAGRRQGRAEAGGQILKEADDARIDFERERARLRDEALARLRDRRALRRGRVRGSDRTGGDGA